MPFVRFRDCTCPESPHVEPSPAWGDLSGDVVELRDQLPFDAAAHALRVLGSMTAEVTAQMGVDANADAIEVAVSSRLFETVGPIYLEHGPLGWNVDRPLDIDSLTFAEKYVIAEAGNDQYTEAILHPLVLRIDRLLANGSTAKSRPPRTKSSQKRRARSGRSS